MDKDEDYEEEVKYVDEWFAWYRTHGEVAKTVANKIKRQQKGEAGDEETKAKKARVS